MLNENETIHSATMSYPDTNYCQKGLTCNMSQLSVESNKSSDPTYDVPSRDAGKESPSKSISDKRSIYNLLWPQPKTVNELKNFTVPFIAGKELFISIIQVIFKYTDVRFDASSQTFRKSYEFMFYSEEILSILYDFSLCVHKLFPRAVNLYIRY